MLQLSVRAVHDPAPVAWSERWCATRAAARAGRSSALQHVVDVCIVASVAFMVAHFQYMHAAGFEPSNPGFGTRWYLFMVAELLIGLIFDAEVALKVLGSGWAAYWHRKWNRFDFTITAMNTAIY
eukprot:gene18197-54854_t